MKKHQLGNKEKHGPIAWMSRNPVAANLIMFVLLVGGLLLVFASKQEVFPEFTIDVVTVSVPYPGASPEEVENGIVLAVEEAVRGLDGIKEVTSTANEGVGTVIAELQSSVNSQKVLQDIKAEVDRISSFPEEAEKPSVTLISPWRLVANVVVYGDVSDKVLREAAETARKKLLNSTGITQVNMGWQKPLEISIEVPQDTLRSYGLTLDKVASQLKAAAVELPGGEIETSGGDILLRMDERREYGYEFLNLPIITTADGTVLKVSDIAKVTDGFQDADREFLFNGMPGLQLQVQRVGNETPSGVSAETKRIIREIEKEMPEGIHFAVKEDMSDVLDQRIDLLLRNAFLGLILVFFILGLFLEIRLAFWVMMGIPISFLGGFLFFPSMGVTINMVSLFAFIVALGIVVDDAIVVGEAIYEYHQRGMAFKDAAIKGAKDIAIPITFSVLTNIVAFVPLAFVPGFMGKMFKAIPFVVITVFAISLFESLYILPAHLANQKDGKAKVGGFLHTWQQGFSHWFVHAVKTFYLPVVKMCLKYRYIVIATGAAVLIVLAAYIATGRIGIVPMTRIESDSAEVVAVLPYGSPIESTKAVGERLKAAAEKVADENGGQQLLEDIFVAVGGSSQGTTGSHVVKVVTLLTDADTRPIATSEFTKLWRQEVGDVVGLKSLSFAFDRMGPGGGKSLEMILSHDNLDDLRAASAELADAIANYPNVSDVEDGFLPGKMQMNFTMKPEGRAVGLTSSSVARQIRYAYYGAEVLRQQRGRNEVKVMVRFPEEERVSLNQLNNMILQTPSGGEIPLFEAVNVHPARAYTSINRKDGQRTVTVGAAITPDSETELVLASVKEEVLPKLFAKYPGLSYSLDGRTKDLRESMHTLIIGFVLAVFGIYALLAIPFKSYLQPAIIMVSIPFGIVGATVGHIIMGYDMSIMSMMGIVALTGVVVNDSLVLIDYANRLNRSGMNAFDSVSMAGVRRFRPILLTTFTTFGGLAPMIFEKSIQAKFLIPMAISLGFGILFATVVSLILVPCLYLVIEDLKTLVLGKSVVVIKEQELLEDVLAN